MPYKKFWPAGDVNIWQTNPTTNYGSISTLSAKAAAGALTILLEFDLTTIPSNATITTATLTLYQQGSTTSISNDIHRLVRDWVEGQATYNEAETGTNWGTAGAANTTTDYNSSLIDTLTTPGDDLPATATVTATVQNWIDGTNPNYGFRISSSDSTPATWHSREGATKALWPHLEVYYTIPTIGYAINGTTVTAGIKAEWTPLDVAGNAAGPPVYSGWYKHIWRIDTMEMTDWLTLHNLRSTALTGITTTNYDTPNVAATYATGRLMSVSGRQQGRQMLGVVAEFLVDETS